MKTGPTIQAEATSPAQLSLEPGAFQEVLLEVVGPNKIGWSGEDHIRLVEAMLPRITDEDGNALELSEDQTDRLRLIFRPNEEMQRRVLKQTLAEAGGELDDSTESAFVLLMNMAQFADYLSKSNKPGTKEKFITKEKKRGAKKGFFEDLINSTAVAPTPGEESPAENESQEEEVVAAPAKPTPKPVAKK